MFADAVPLPQAALARPDAAPAVGADLLEAIIVDLSRPERGRFTVRLYDESFRPPPADVTAAYVLYGPGVRRLARELEAEWTARRIEPDLREELPRLVTWIHATGLREVQAAIEALQQRHLP